MDASMAAQLAAHVRRIISLVLVVGGAGVGLAPRPRRGAKRAAEAAVARQKSSPRAEDRIADRIGSVGLRWLRDFSHPSHVP